MEDLKLRPLKVKIPVYALWLFASIDFFLLVSTEYDKFNAPALFRFCFGVAIIYFTSTKSLKIGGVYYIFLALTLTALAVFYDLLFTPLAVLAIFAAYVLLKTKPLSIKDTSIAQEENASRIFDHQYKGYDVYKSKNLYWFRDESFTNIKEVEAHIEDLIAQNPE